MKSPRSFWIFLIVGILLRSVALNQPLIDAHLFRQCQTADAVQSLIDAPGWELSARASWLGDTGGRLVQELPLYNFLVVLLHRVTGHLDASGKIVTILLWAASFICLQSLWLRLLTARQTLWANFLFVLSPLSIFFGQAFMPEMLIRLCEFAFLAALLAYCEKERLSLFIICTVAGAIGMLVKTPEFSHLYIAAGLILFQKEGWRVLRRPRYWVALIATAACVKGWASFIDATNAQSFPEWTASASSQGMFGSLRDRFSLHPYLKYAGYLAIFACTPAGLLLALLGGWSVTRRAREHRILVAWGISVAAFYAVWGPRTAGEHSYYHLPALGVACALFGIGAERLCEFASGWRGLPAARTACVAIALAVLAASAGATLYLFQQDRTIFSAAIWVKENVPKGELVLFKMNHRQEIDYAHVPTFSYYAKRNAWVFSRLMPDVRRVRALQTSKWAVVTRPHEDDGTVGRLRRLLRGGERRIEPEDMSWLEKDAGFVRFTETPEFTVYKKRAATDAAGGS